MDEVPQTVKDALPGIAGSAVALRWYLRHGRGAAVAMFFGGSVLAFVGSHYIAAALSMPGAVGLTGFLLGMLGMTIISKVFDAIEHIDPKAIAEWIQQKLFKGGR